MWSAAAEVIDDGADAPRGAKILGINLLWGGKGRAATYALLKALGHPVEAWTRETDAAKIPDITPDFFYDRPFVLDCAINDKGYLEPNGYAPYFPKNARRGPAPAATVGQANARLASGGGAKAQGAASGAGGTAPASAAPSGDNDALPF
jgi:hypothetical protein